MPEGRSIVEINTLDLDDAIFVVAKGYGQTGVARGPRRETEELKVTECVALKRLLGFPLNEPQVHCRLVVVAGDVVVPCALTRNSSVAPDDL